MRLFLELTLFLAKKDLREVTQYKFLLAKKTTLHFLFSFNFLNVLKLFFTNKVILN